jgi:protein phosphatase
MIAIGCSRPDWCGRTDIGKERRENQDLFLSADISLGLNIEQSTSSEVGHFREHIGRLLLVADGMGGQAAGAEASKLGAEAFLEGFLCRAALLARRGASLEKDLRPILSSSLFEAHRKVLQAGNAQPHLSGMGTTLTVAVLMGPTLFVAHVGDSRCYLLRGSKFTRLTHDHTFVQWCIDHDTMSEDDAKKSQLSHILWNAIGGQSGGLVPEVNQYRVEAGDVVLLCTDGLTRAVSEEEIVQILKGDDLESVAEELVNAANQAGGPDNITVLVSRVPDLCGEDLPTTRGVAFSRLS